MTRPSTRRGPSRSAIIDSGATFNAAHSPIDASRGSAHAHAASLSFRLHKRCRCGDASQNETRGGSGTPLRVIVAKYSGRMNRRLWIGLLLSLVAVVSYGVFFYRWPITRDVPWVSFILLAIAVWLLVTGFRRATRKVWAGIVAALGIVIAALFVLGVTIGSPPPPPPPPPPAPAPPPP